MKYYYNIDQSFGRLLPIKNAGVYDIKVYDSKTSKIIKVIIKALAIIANQKCRNSRNIKLGFKNMKYC